VKLNGEGKRLAITTLLLSLSDVVIGHRGSAVSAFNSSQNPAYITTGRVLWLLLMLCDWPVAVA